MYQCAFSNKAVAERDMHACNAAIKIENDCLLGASAAHRGCFEDTARLHMYASSGEQGSKGNTSWIGWSLRTASP